VAHEIGFDQMIGHNPGLIGRHTGGLEEFIPELLQTFMIDSWHSISPFREL
jgi:hypothetical protein